jgi:hypothetical protein
VNDDIRRRLHAAGIEYAAAGEQSRYFFLARAPFAVMVDSAAHRIGAAGRMTDKGLAVLVWRDGEPWFQAKGFAEAAASEEIDLLRRFQAEVEAMLAPAGSAP